jgi:poly(A) polymerase
MIVLVHLNSDSNSFKKRSDQVSYIIWKTKHFDDCLFMGDFNFGGFFSFLKKDGEENNSMNFENYFYKDVWKNLNNENGFTMDPKLNSLAKITSKTGNRNRIDRVFLKSMNNFIKMKSIVITANIPFVFNDLNLFLSDHFALESEFIFD